MSGIRSITRRPDMSAFYSSSGSAPCYVNQTDNSFRINPIGSGTTESNVLLGVGGVTGAFRTAQGSGALVTGSLVVNTGLSTVTSFVATVYGATGFASGATEVDAIMVSSITTGAVTVKGLYNSFVTGARTISVSGTATFYWEAMGT